MLTNIRIEYPENSMCERYKQLINIYQQETVSYTIIGRVLRIEAVNLISSQPVRVRSNCWSF